MRLIDADALKDDILKSKEKPMMVELEFSPDVGRSEMAQMLKEWAEREGE